MKIVHYRSAVFGNKNVSKVKIAIKLFPFNENSRKLEYIFLKRRLLFSVNPGPVGRRPSLILRHLLLLIGRTFIRPIWLTFPHFFVFLIETLQNYELTQEKLQSASSKGVLIDLSHLETFLFPKNAER